MVGAAIAAGYIHSVDDPVTSYIPELARKDYRFASITLRDLLDMRSGLALGTTSFPLNDNTVIDHTTDLRQAVLDRVRIDTIPGTTFRYNDFNPLLIGIVLERVTGMTVTQWLDQTLWQPMGAQYSGSFSIDSTAGGFEKMERDGGLGSSTGLRSITPGATTASTCWLRRVWTSWSPASGASSASANLWGTHREATWACRFGHRC